MQNSTVVATPVLLPLTPEMTETLKRLLNRAVHDGHGQITITVMPREVRIVETNEKRFAWV